MKKTQYYITFVGAFVFGFVALNIYNTIDIATRLSPNVRNNIEIIEDDEQHLSMEFVDGLLDMSKETIHTLKLKLENDE